MLFIIFFILNIHLAWKAESVESVRNISITSPSIQELILCRQCGSDVASSNHIISKTSPASEYTFNDTLFGKDRVLIQVLRTDYLLDIPIITFGHSECMPIGEWSETEFWFPKYQWKACVCPSCGELIGWVFQPINPSRNKISQNFFALDLHSLVGEKCKYILFYIENMCFLLEISRALYTLLYRSVHKMGYVGLPSKIVLSL